MKKGWSVVIAIVFLTILLGAICIGVGYLTSADMARISSVIEGSPVYGYVQMLIQLWNQTLVQVSQLL